MASAPQDYLYRFALDALLAIRTSSLELTAAPAAAPPVLTVCFWVQAQSLPATQVIVNWGHRYAGESGWSCFLQDGQLVVSVCSDGGKRVTSAHAWPEDEHWHHVAAVFDSEQPAVTTWLDGVRKGCSLSAIALRPEAPVGGTAGLVAGGYTDAAGGHFDYSFGRGGRGIVDDLRIYVRALAEDEITSFVAPAAPAPAAGFSWDAPHSAAPVRVRFSASTGGPPGTICLWTWPGGGYSLGPTAEHDFAYAGRYSVRLDVIDPSHAQAHCEEVLELDGLPNPLCVTPVFTSGEGGYAAFRIPSIVRAANGDLVAFAEGRVESAGDATRTIRIVSKRSRDGGRSWGPLCVVASNLLEGGEYAAMNASPAVDTVHGTGRIVLVFKKLECSEWEIAQGRGVMRTFCILSDDHGQSWYGERDITGEVHRPYLPAYAAVCPAAAQAANRAHDWRIQVPTLGHAIQLRGTEACPAARGRILHIGSRTHAGDSVFDSVNYAFWSDDLGASWQIGGSITTRWDGSAACGLNEAAAVELPDGRVLVNSRNYRERQPVRQRAVTLGTFDEDGHITFGPARHDGTLVEPAVQASLLRYSWPGNGGRRSRVLFANPAHAFARTNMTVRLSYDEGATWPVAKVIDAGPSAYSDLVVEADGDIGLLYERGNAGGIVYAGFSLAWLTDGQDTFGEDEQHA